MALTLIHWLYDGTVSHKEYGSDKTLHAGLRIIRNTGTLKKLHFETCILLMDSESTTLR